MLNKLERNKKILKERYRDFTVRLQYFQVLNYETIWISMVIKVQRDLTGQGFGDKTFF